MKVIALMNFNHNGISFEKNKIYEVENNIGICYTSLKMLAKVIEPEIKEPEQVKEQPEQVKEEKQYFELTKEFKKQSKNKQK